MKEGLLTFQLTLFDYIDQFTKQTAWKSITVLVCTFSCIFLNNPEYHRFQDLESITPEFRDYRHNWQALHDQIESPLTPRPYPSTSHQSKKAFRLLPPLIGKLFPVENRFSTLIGLFIFQHLLGLLGFYILLELILTVTKDRVYTFLATLCFSFIYYGISFFWDLYGWFDGIAYFMLLATMYFLIQSNLLLAFFSLSAAFWTDERAIIVSPVLVFWHMINQKSLDYFKISHLQRVIVWYFFCIVLYLAIRFYLSIVYGLTIPLGFNALVGLKMILINMQPIPYSLFSIFEGLWLPFILMVIWLWKRKDNGILAGSFLLFVVPVIASLCVIDVTRSLTYIFPWILSAILLMHRTNDKIFSRRVILISLLISIGYPNLFYLGKSPVIVSNYKQIITYLGLH